MKVKLHMYVAQPRKGLYEASIPWVGPLASPLRGPSPAQLKEELMFRALELVHDQLDASELDRLIPPEQPYVTSIYLDIERQVDPERPPRQLNAVTHVVVGSWPDEELTRLWLPRVPGVCLAVRRVDDMYAALNRWARQFADDNKLENFDSLACNHVGSIEAFEIDLGFPVPSHLSGTAGPGGRLRRPETLNQVAYNLSHRAEDDTLGRAFGREHLVEELVEVLTSPRPANICLIGPAGVGKTALVHEAARRVWSLSRAYQERCDIWQTKGDRIIAGMSIIGQWERRTESMCRELAERGDILFVEDLLGLVRAGRTFQGDSNVARFIEPYVEQDRFSVIVEATEETYALARSMAPGFVDKFRRVQVPELSYRETLSVLTDLIRELEGQHGLRFTADGLEAILHLSRRFFRTEAFPGKAVRLVKQCQHEALRVQNEEGVYEVRVDPERVARVVQRQTGLPMTILRPGTGRAPDEIERTFSNRVFGQPAAVDAVTSLVVAIEQGLTDPKRPLGSFLLVGPSGVGKTETAKTLAADLFGSIDRMIRFDMSEFSEALSVSRLIGTPRNPEGELTGKVRLQPFCVLLFDEIEKAHPIVLDLLLQLLGDGRLTDAAGRTADFRNAIVIMTSNLGAASEDRWLGFSEATVEDRTLHYRRAAEEFFRPELFNRIDYIVPYRPLGPEALRRIARRTLQNLLERRGLRQAQVMVDVDDGLIDYLARRSVDSRYGARTLAHRIEKTLIHPLARRLSQHPADAGLTRVTMTPSEDGVGLELETIEKAPRLSAATDEQADARDEQTRLMQQLSDIAARVRALVEDPRCAAVEEEYEQILGQFNAATSEGEDASALAERLRQREVFLNRVAELERRVAGLMDPRGTGEFLFSTTSDDRKAKTHRFVKIAEELDRQLVWLTCQLERLDARDDAGCTLVVSGLSGPYEDSLAGWHRRLEALGDELDLELVFAYRTSEDWTEPTRRPATMQGLTAFAVSSEVPGVRDVFERLAGYVWRPQPPSHGQHALVIVRTLAGGSSNPERLIERMRTHMATQQVPAFIEFVELDGQLEDVRLGRARPIPDDRATNVGRFMAELVTDRLAHLSAAQS